ncbi:uncharacterized protein [Nicotiana sylvestris]|uniref:uncharacterized protein n=1 Tax=Nicotiana sylvestris TaxID=4096 RepID=UPI00388C9BC5
MYHDLKEVYWWNNMKRYVADFVAKCPNCQQVKAEHQRPGGMLKSIENPLWKFEMINMDFVVGLSRTTRKFDSIWVTVDRLTKLACFLPIKSTDTMEQYAQLYIQEIARMKDDESIQDMHTRFSFIINELHSLGEVIPKNKLVIKILSVLPSSWESKVNAITEAEGLDELTIDELVGNLKTYEMKKKKKKKYYDRREPKTEKNLVLKTDINDSSGEDGDVAYLTRRFQKMVHRNGGIPKRESSRKQKYYDLCHKCAKPRHFIKDFPLLKQNQDKKNFDKAAKRNPVLDKRFKRKNVADNVVKQALASWGNSSSESEEKSDHVKNSMMAVESEVTEYDSIFALMAQSDDDEDDNDDEVNFWILIHNKDALTVELREVEQTGDNLVVVVVDLKETIKNLKKEKDALNEKIANIKHEIDDLMVVVVDLKKTIECVKREKEVVADKITNLEHERDDLLVVVVDLKETIWELKMESRPENSQKGNEVASEAHIKLESGLNSVKSSLCVDLEKNKQLQEELGKVKSDLEKSLKWTWSYDAIAAMYTNKGGNRQRIGFQREKIPYNPHSNYITGTMNRSSLQWFMDSGCTKHMNGSTNAFLSLKSLQGGSVSFGNGKKGYILGVGRIGSGLSVVDDDAKLWHRRLGHASFTLVNKLVRKYLVHGLLKSSFKDHKVCDACVKGKQVRSSFKPKKEVSISRPLDLLHMDLCGPMRLPSRGGKKYIFVIVDDYSRFTWTLFLRTKDETFKVFVAFVKKIQVKMGNKVACIRSDHRIEFDNAKFDELCNKNGINHNFSAPRTPQQKWCCG